jgi:hypothetical protein
LLSAFQWNLMMRSTLVSSPSNKLRWVQCQSDARLDIVAPGANQEIRETHGFWCTEFTR